MAASGSSSKAKPTVTTASAPTVTKSKNGRYIVVMKGDPLVKTVPQDQLGTAKGKAGKARLEAQQNATLRDANVSTSSKKQSYTNALNGFTVATDLAGAERLSRDPKVAVVMPDELRQVQSDSTGGGKGNNAISTNGLNSFLGLTDRGQAYAQGITGKGVLVGVIDTGVWPEHPSFAPNPKSGARPARFAADPTACTFGNTAWNPNDVPFACNNKLVGARETLDTYKSVIGLEPAEFDSARDNEGHGTHTASTAAGNPNVKASVFGVAKGTVSGIAPDAQVIVYKALGDQGGFTSDLVDAIDTAVFDGVDVINYSIGGGASIVSGDTISFLFAADAGVFSAVSAGNDGPGAATIGGPADVPWVTSVGANTYPTFYQGTVNVTGGPRVVGASITKGSVRAPFVDAAAAGSALCIPGALDPTKVTGKIVLCGRGTNGRVNKSFAVQQAGGVGMVLYNQTDDDTLFSDNFWVPTVMVDRTPGQRIRDFVAAHPGATGQLVNDGVTKSPIPTPVMAQFSSRGENPTAGDIIKPDVTAPGVQVLAGQTPMPSTTDSGPSGELFQAIAGTSMSSPVVAGSYAPLKQAHPDWSAAAAKSALMTNADTKVRNNDRKTQAGPFDMGSGLAVLGKPGSRGTAFQPGLVYDAGFDDYLGFLCAEGREAFSNPDATCASLGARGIPTVAADLNYPSIGVEAVAGTTTVTRTVTNVTGRRQLFVANTDAPAGYRVTVSPRVLNLAADASATFTVTITNRGSAPVGEWRFGALTWKGLGYDVRSPIAVKGVAIKAPASVTGTGASGTASIPVQFGVAGAYQAVPHGLAAQTNNPGTISQDPDQTFPSADDGAGVVKIPFDLSAAAFARWTLKDPASTDDLDLYLLGPDGTVVAQSTNGGTNEQIDLSAPAPGTYTMVVHGWAVGAPNTPFDLLSWVVPTATGGSLQVTSGGSLNATVGGSTTVGVSWTGAGPGTSLGLVDHVVGGTVLAQTAVTVTNP